MSREPDVAIIEADDVEATFGELLAKVLAPGDHLRAEAHHEHDGLVRGVAEALVAEGDAAADVGELFAGHGYRVWQAPVARRLAAG